MITLNEYTSREDGTRILVEQYNEDDDEERQGTEANNNMTFNTSSSLSSIDDYTEDDGVTCMICLEPFRKGDKVSWSEEMKCHYIFHREYIFPWLMNHEDCPSCRGSFILEEAPSDDHNKSDNFPNSHSNKDDNDDDSAGRYYIINGLISRASHRVRRSFIESVHRMHSISTDESITSTDPGDATIITTNHVAAMEQIRDVESLDILYSVSDNHLEENNSNNNPSEIQPTRGRGSRHQKDNIIIMDHLADTIQQTFRNVYRSPCEHTGECRAYRYIIEPTTNTTHDETNKNKTVKSMRKEVLKKYE